MPKGTKFSIRWLELDFAYHMQESDEAESTPGDPRIHKNNLAKDPHKKFRLSIWPRVEVSRADWVGTDVDESPRPFRWISCDEDLYLVSYFSGVES